MDNGVRYIRDVMRRKLDMNLLLEVDKLKYMLGRKYSFLEEFKKLLRNLMNF